MERGKTEEMNQSGLLYIYTWKIPCVAILNKQKGHFFFLSFAKSEKEGGTSPFWGAETSWREEEVGKGCRR
jgi:hypothetical protein